MALLLGIGTLSGCGSEPAATGSSTPADVPVSEESEEASDSASGQESASESAPEAESQAEGPDISEEVTLTMYLIGDRPVDNDEVFAKINEKLKAEINATIDVKFMSWGEYEQKYPLIFASGEDWDIIYTADWCFYNAQATKQGFWEITQEALDTYAPMTAASIYPEAWEQAKVDGQVFMLPMNYKEITSYVYMARGDLMDKYDIKSVASLDEAEAYMDAMGSVSETDDNAEVKGVYDQPEFQGVIERLKSWKDKGFWSKNAVVNTQNNTESFQAGKSALALCNANTAKSIYTQMSTEHPEWDVRVFDAQDGVPPVLNSYLANGMSIFSKSKYPERALMALDYLRNDVEINNLFCYGIEGKHWEASGDNALVSLPDSSNYAYDSNCNWGVRNDASWRVVEGGIPGLEELNAQWKETAYSRRYQTFVFNDGDVKNEIAAITEIFNSEYKLLGLGFTDDPAGDIAKLKENMAAAGADTVYAEMQKQAQEFLSTNEN